MSDHSHDIMLKLNNDRKTSAKYCDITLIVDEHKYPAHKCVLGLLSPFYDKMFSIEMKERFDNEAVIKGVSKEVFEAILEFVYTSSITLNMENVFGIIEAAHYMDLPYVKECCVTYLGNEVNAENWLKIKSYAQRYDYEDLLPKIDESLSEKFDSVISSKNFVELEVDELIHLLRVDNRTLEFEEKLYKAVIGWIKLDVTGRAKHLNDLITYIQFSEMSFDFLTKVVSKEKLIEDCHASLKLVFNAIGNYKPPAPKKLSIMDQPSTSKQVVNTWSLKTFIAVSSRTVFEVSGTGLKKRDLYYNHAGGSAVKFKSNDILVISGIDTKQMESVKTFNFELSIDYCYATIENRYLAAAVECNNQVYITGGLSSETASEVREYRKGNVWKWKKEMNFNRHGHALVSLCGAIYVIGGKPSDSFICFDPRLNTTKTLASLPTSRHFLAAVVLGEEIYAIGGIFVMSASTTVEKYNLLSGKWKRVANLNVARSRPGACVVDNQIIVVGGGSGVVEVYDEKKNQWIVVGTYEDLKDVFSVFSGFDCSWGSLWKQPEHLRVDHTEFITL